MSGSIVTQSTEKGLDVFDLKRGGVSLKISLQNGRKQIISAIDQSGHGAVGCAWAIYLAELSTLQTCFPGKYPGIKTDLMDQIAAINNFIAQNSLVPLTLNEVELAASEVEESYRIQFHRSSPKHNKQLCRTDDTGDLSPLFRKTRSQIQTDTSALLSVPRPPVAAPCF